MTSKAMLEIEDFKAGTHRKSKGGPVGMSLWRLRLEPGKMYALVSASGAGKSVLLSLLCGLPPACWRGRMAWQSWAIFETMVKPESPVAHFGPRHSLFDIPGRAKLIYLPQHFPTDRSEDINAADAMSFFYRAALPSVSANDARRAITRVVEKFGMDPRMLNQSLAELSGGQRRRLELLVRLETLLVRNEQAGTGERPAALVLLDEPTTGLDVYNERLFIDSISKLRSHEVFQSLDFSIVVSTHAFSQLIAGRDYFDEVIVLNRDPADNITRLVFQGHLNDAIGYFSAIAVQKAANGGKHPAPLIEWEQIIELLEKSDSAMLESAFAESIGKS